MSFRIVRHLHDKDMPGTFNMTPIIDIVFLLIIFFLLVCRFIEAENFPVAVPDECKFAQSQNEAETGKTTVTIMKTTEEEIEFAVGSEKIVCSDNSNIVEELAKLIDARLKNSPPDGRIVILRIDKDICFGQAQYALAGVAASCATDIQLSALKNKRADSR